MEFQSRLDLHSYLLYAQLNFSKSYQLNLIWLSAAAGALPHMSGIWTELVGIYTFGF